MRHIFHLLWLCGWLLLAACGSAGESAAIDSQVHDDPVPAPRALALAFDARGALVRFDPLDGAVLARASPAAPRHVDGPPLDVSASRRAAYVVRGRGTERRIDVHALAGERVSAGRIVAELHGEVGVQALPRAVLAFRPVDAGFWLALDDGGGLAARYDLPAPGAWWLEGDALLACVDDGRRLLRASLSAGGGGIDAFDVWDSGGQGQWAPHPEGMVSVRLDDGWLRLVLRREAEADVWMDVDLGSGTLEQVVAAAYRPGRIAILSAHPTQLTVLDVSGHPPWRYARALIQEPLRPHPGMARRDLMVLPQGLFVAGRRRMLRLRYFDGPNTLEMDEGFPGEDLRGPVVALAEEATW